jgi:hypothetical protein
MQVNDYKIHMKDYLQKISEAFEKSLDKKFEDIRDYLWDSIGGYYSSQPGSRLIQCGMGMLPKASGVGKAANELPPNPSIIYNGYLSGGKPIHLDQEVVEWLARDGITKIVVGHQPNGDTPFTIDEYGVQVRYISAQAPCTDFYFL